MFAAGQFTEVEGFFPDSHLVEAPYDALVETVAAQVAQGLFEQIAHYRASRYLPYMALGGDCGNVHLQVLKFLKEEYPSVAANLTFGEVILDGYPSFPFDRERFRSWQQHRPDRFDCHAWITIGTSYIIDATIGTYITTRIGGSKAFGGVLHGRPQLLRIIPIANEQHMDPKGVQNITYNPIVLGRSALLACAPPFRPGGLAQH